MFNLISTTMSEIFSKAWEYFKQHWIFLSVVSAIGVLVPALLTAVPIIKVWLQAKAGTIDYPDFQSFYTAILAQVGIFGCIGMIVLFLAIAGLIKASLKITEGGTPQVSDVFLDGGTYLKGFLALLVCTILYAIGMVLCVVPGLILMFFTVFVPFEVIGNPNAGVMDAIKNSFKLVKSDWKTTIVVFLVGYIITSVLGSTGIGLIPAYPFFYLALTVLYRQLKGQGMAAPQIDAPEPQQQY